MDFTPIAPTQLDGSVKNELLVLAEEIVIKSAKIEGSHNKIILTSIKNILPYSIYLKIKQHLKVKIFFTILLFDVTFLKVFFALFLYTTQC